MSIVMHTPWADVILVPGVQRSVWCEECKTESGYELDFFGMTGDYISPSPLATIYGCFRCDDEGEEE